MLYIVGLVLALALGIYIGLGSPGLPGRQDRFVASGRARPPRRKSVPLDWLKKNRR